MKILVTGATGFIGNNLVNEILKNQDLEIITSSRSLEKASKFNWFNKTKYIPYDVNEEKTLDLFNYFDKPDKVIHLAWDGLPNYDNLIHIEKNLFNNYRFIKNLVSKGLKDITITGTCFEYGLAEGCLNENLVTNPSNSYGIAKDTLRKTIEELRKQYKFNYKWVRLFYMFGDGQNENSLIASLDKAIKNRETEFNMSKGDQIRDYLHISEVVSNILKISLQSRVDNQIINCCSGKPISVKKFVDQYLEKQKYKMKLNLGYYPYPGHEPMSFWGDTTKLRNIIYD